MFIRPNDTYGTDKHEEVYVWMSKGELFFIHIRRIVIQNEAHVSENSFDWL